MADTSRRIYVVDGWYRDFSVRNNQVDYGAGLASADSWEYYNSDYVAYFVECYNKSTVASHPKI